MTTLISRDTTLQVRKARHMHICYGVGRSIRAAECKGEIAVGETYICKVEEQPFVRHVPRWKGDKRRYCAHCALKNLPAISVGPVAA
jgi:hypothetical protein